MRSLHEKETLLLKLLMPKRCNVLQSVHRCDFYDSYCRFILVIIIIYNNCHNNWHNNNNVARD